MCLHFKYTEGRNPRIAEHDFPVFKVLQKLREGGLVSPFRIAPYATNTGYAVGLGMPVTVISESTQVAYLRVSEGLHTLMSIYDAKRLIEQLRLDDANVLSEPATATYVVLHAVIPKGASYYLGNNGDVVSNHLNILEEADVPTLPA